MAKQNISTLCYQFIVHFYRKLLNHVILSYVLDVDRPRLGLELDRFSRKSIYLHAIAIINLNVIIHYSYQKVEGFLDLDSRSTNFNLNLALADFN